MQLAAQPTARQKYHVLLMLTDGCIMDMAATLAALVDASGLPLSLLIVGVGSEDFAAMQVRQDVQCCHWLRMVQFTWHVCSFFTAAGMPADADGCVQATQLSGMSSSAAGAAMLCRRWTATKSASRRQTGGRLRGIACSFVSCARTRWVACDKEGVVERCVHSGGGGKGRLCSHCRQRRTHCCCGVWCARNSTLLAVKH